MSESQRQPPQSTTNRRGRGRGQSYRGRGRSQSQSYRGRGQSQGRGQPNYQEYDNSNDNSNDNDKGNWQVEDQRLQHSYLTYQNQNQTQPDPKMYVLELSVDGTESTSVTSVVLARKVSQARNFLRSVLCGKNVKSATYPGSKLNFVVLDKHLSMQRKLEKTNEGNDHDEEDGFNLLPKTVMDQEANMWFYRTVETSKGEDGRSVVECGDWTTTGCTLNEAIDNAYLAVIRAATVVRVD